MGKTVISAKSVGEVADGGVLMIPNGAVVTPLARDLASARKIQLQREEDAPPGSAAPARRHVQASDALIAEIVTQVLARRCRNETKSASGAVQVIHGRSTLLAPIVGAKQQVPGTRVSGAEVLGPNDGAPFIAGYLTVTGDPWRRPAGAAELLIVLEGELNVGEGASRSVAHPGDVIHVSHGTQTVVSSPSWARVFYVRAGSV